MHLYKVPKLLTEAERRDPAKRDKNPLIRPNYINIRTSGDDRY
jgi:hypothetical protein